MKFSPMFLPFSEGRDNGIIAYYVSEFNIRETRLALVEEALERLMVGGENGRQSRRGSGRTTDNILIIDGMTSGGKSNATEFHVNFIVTVFRIVKLSK